MLDAHFEMVAFLKGRRGLLLVVVALAVVGVFAHRPAISALRDWRAKNLLSEARQQIEEKNWVEARRAALASGKLNPSLESTRLYFEALENSSHPDILRAATALALYPGADAGDHAMALAAFLNQRDFINFALLLRALGREGMAHPKVRYEIVRFLLATGKPKAAIRLVDAVPADERTPEFDLLLARELIRSQSEEARSEAVARLAKLLDHPERRIALAAMGVLVTQRDEQIPSSLAKKSVERFADDPMLNVRERFGLALLKLGLAVDPEERGVLVEQVIADHRVENFERLLSWLLRISAPTRVVELTDEREITAPIFPHRATALIALGQLEQLRSELDDPPLGIKPVDLNVSRATVARLMGRSAEEIRHWQDAFKFARMTPSQNQFYKIAMAARQVGATDAQMEALVCAIEHPLGVPPPSSQMGELTSWLEERDTERLLAICRKLLRNEPGDPSLINNFHYLTALHGTPNENTIDALKKLVEAFPDSIHFRGSLAFAQLRIGRADEALDTFDSTGVLPQSLPNTEKAVYSAILSAVGRERDAEVLRGSVQWGRLNAGEAEVLGGKR